MFSRRLSEDAALDAGVKALGHRTRQKRLVPGVEEVSVPRVRRARGQGYRSRVSDDPVVCDQRQARQHHRVAGRTTAESAVRHVALMVRAVRADAVPALREEDMQGQRVLIRAGRRRLGRPEARPGLRTAQPSAVPERRAESLRAGRGRVAGDNAEARRERLDRKSVV